VLAYDLSLVDFEALQEAGPAQPGAAAASGPAAAAVQTGSAPTAVTVPAAAVGAGRAGVVPGLPGVPQQ